MSVTDRAIGYNCIPEILLEFNYWLLRHLGWMDWTDCDSLAENLLSLLSKPNS